MWRGPAIHPSRRDPTSSREGLLYPGAKCSHSTVKRAGRKEGEGYSDVWELTGDGTRAVAKVTTDSIPRLS